MQLRTEHRDAKEHSPPLRNLLTFTQLPWTEGAGFSKQH